MVSLLKKSERNYSLDFLRGIAIIGVIAVHTSQGFTTNIAHLDYLLGLGRFGVQLFFVVSAITICAMWLHRRHEANHKRNFLIRRISRIAPLFWLGIVVYAAMWHWGSINVEDSFYAATLLSGLKANVINTIVPGGWSIHVEVMFYLSFPILSKLLSGRRSNTLLIGFIYWIFYAYLGRDFAGQFLFNSLDGIALKEALYLSFLNQFPIFLIGIFVFRLLESDVRRLSRSEVIIFFFWVGIAAFTSFYRKDSSQALIVVGIVIGAVSYLTLRYNLCIKCVSQLGKYTYGMYIFHFAVISLLHQLFEKYSGPFVFVSTFVLTSTISYFLAFLSYKLFEVPAERSIRNILIAKQ